MKKQLLRFGILLSFVLLFVGFNSQRVFVYADDMRFIYEEIEGEAIKITGYNGAEEVVDIPKEINGKPVTTLGGDAFNNSFHPNVKNIKRINMPSITQIEDGPQGTFKGCIALETVDMPKMTSIEGNLFKDCTSIESVSMPNVTDIGEEAFYGCSGLTSVNMPKIKNVGLQAFMGCSSLTNVDMPNVTEIGDGAFKNNGLTSVTIPKSATKIGYSAFGNCSALQSVTILSDNVDIKGNSFENTNLEKIYCNPGSTAEEYAKKHNKQCVFLSSNSNPGPAHEHNWVWETITEPTEYSDGMEGYVCYACGATKDTVTVPSSGVFMDNRYKQVISAKDGDTVVLEMGPWHSLSKGFMQEIANKRNATFVIHFIYAGKKYEVVIPAGQPLVLDPTIDWYGPLKQNEMFGMKEVQ